MHNWIPLLLIPVPALAVPMANDSGGTWPHNAPMHNSVDATGGSDPVPDRCEYGDGDEDGICDPENSHCPFAYEADVGANPSTNLGAPVVDLPDCGAPAGDNGVWHTFTASIHADVTFSTCDGTHFDSILHLYKGDECSSTTCVTGNDNACGTQSSVTVTVAPGERYYILTQGVVASDEGPFVLTIDAVPHISDTGTPDTGGQPPTEDTADDVSPQGEEPITNSQSACGCAHTGAGGLLLPLLVGLLIRRRRR